MTIKTPKEPRQLKFFEVLFETGDKEQARLAAEYSKSYTIAICNKYVNYIHDHVNGHFAAEGVKAASKIIDSMDYNGDIPKDMHRIQVEAARDVLDRQGLSKAERVDLNINSVASPMFFLPAKEEKARSEDA